VAHYIDTSALVKLIVAESETPGLRAWLAQTNRDPVTCNLTRTELMRAVRRVAPDRVIQARTVLDSLTIIDVTTEVFEEAGRLDPTILRSLDALHLAAALSLGDDLETLVTYDDRLTQAAHATGIRTTSPA
jgi:predicted nucleic acid-binding protein